MPRVDYDRIAHLYDEPCRDHDVDPNLAAFLADRPSIGPDAVCVLDAGCGTGKQLAADRRAFPRATLVGLDRFRGMLHVAGRRCPEVSWVHGDGACLPFPDSTFHYITNQFSYAHIPDKSGFFRELFRVLRPGGRFVMTNIDPWSMPDWIIYRFFPASQRLDLRDFLPADRFVACLQSVGFTDVAVDRTSRRTCECLTDFLDTASLRHKASQFMAISDGAYEAGIDTIRETIARSQEASPCVLSEMCLITVCADRPAD